MATPAATPSPTSRTPRRPVTRAEIASRAQTDPAFREGLLAAADLIRILAAGRINV